MIIVALPYENSKKKIEFQIFLSSNDKKYYFDKNCFNSGRRDVHVKSKFHLVGFWLHFQKKTKKKKKKMKKKLLLRLNAIVLKTPGKKILTRGEEQAERC